MIEKTFTNCFLVKRRGGKKKGRVLGRPLGPPVWVCLAMKKRGWGEGKWNGSGGKPQEGETIEEATKREVTEELGVKIIKMEKVAQINWYLRQEDRMVRCHIFLADNWEGEPVETEEMRPEWFRLDKIPWDEMWASDREWLKIVLGGRKIEADYVYEKDGGKVEKSQIRDLGGR